MPASFCVLSRSAVFCLLTIILLFNIAAFGGVYSWSILITQALLLAALLIHIPAIFFEHDYGANLPTFARAALAAFVVFLVYIALQSRSGLTLDSGQCIGTAARFETSESLIQMAYYFIFFYLCLKTFSHRSFQKSVLSVVGLFAFLVTLFGWVQKASGTAKMYWHYDAGTTNFFGPFVYENNYGAFMCLTLPIIIALTAYRYILTWREWSAETVKRPTFLLARLGSSGAIFFFFVTALSFAALIISGARFSSAVIFTTSILTTIVLVTVKRVKSLALAAVLGVCCVAFLASLIDFNSLGNSFDTSTYGSQVMFRMKLYSDSLKMFLHRPLFGWGIGSFAFANTPFLTQASEAMSFAHPNNDHIELLVEAGLSGALLVSAFVACIIAGAVGPIMKTKSAFARLVGCQAAFGLFSLGLTSLFDSHLKIPALAFLCLFQIALLTHAGTEAARLGVPSEEQSGRSAIRQRYGVKAVAFVGAATMIAWLLPCLVRSLEVRRLLSTAQIDSVEAAAKLHPDDAKLHQRIAKLQYARVLDDHDASMRQAHLDAATQSAKRSAVLYPIFAHYWFTYGQFEYIGGHRPEGIEAVEKAALLSPSNRMYAIVLMSLYLNEFEKMLSSKKKAEYWEKARQTYRALINGGKQETYDGMYSTWMMYYNAGLVQKLKASM